MIPTKPDACAQPMDAGAPDPELANALAYEALDQEAQREADRLGLPDRSRDIPF